MKSLTEYILEQLMLERRVMTFGSDEHVYPKNGWCVILAGGPGSGKGYTIENKIMLNARVIDVDELKKQYIRKYHPKKEGTDKELDLHNPEDVSILHGLVDDKKWKEAIYKIALRQHKVQDFEFGGYKDAEKLSADKLPNIIFDITGKDPDKKIINGIVKHTKELGYKNALIWVVATRSESIIRNLERDRIVGDEILHDIYNKLAEQMPKFIESKDCGEYFEDAWIAWASSEDIQNPQYKDIKNAMIKLNKVSGAFKFDDKIKKKLADYLDVIEEDPMHPKTYLSSEEILKNYGVSVEVVDKQTGKKKTKYKIQREKIKDVEGNIKHNLKR